MHARAAALRSVLTREAGSVPVARLEEVALNAWPGLQQVLYDGWVLRFAKGYTKRANSVNPVYGSSLDPEEKIAFCEAAYAARGLPPVFRLTPFSHPEPLDRLLDERDYVVGRAADVLVLDLAGSQAGSPAASLATEPAGADAAGRLREESLGAWLETFRRFGAADPAGQEAHGEILAAIQFRRLLASLEVGGRVVACGVAVQEGPWCGLFDLVTDPEVRRRGHGRALTHALLAWGRSQGARHAYLQVMHVNEAARNLYDDIGFRKAYHYWYRFPPGSGG